MKFNWVHTKSVKVLTIILFLLEFSGVAVGCGWQTFVAYVNVGCYYGVGIPLGCLLGFKYDLGAKVFSITHNFRCLVYL